MMNSPLYEDSESDNGLHEAIAAKNLHNVQALLVKNIDIHYIGDWACTPLEYAVELGCLDIAIVLLNAGASPHGGVNIGPLPQAIEMGRSDIVSALIRAGADINKDLGEGYTALIVAASHGKLDIVKMLVEMGANVNAVTEDGNSALMNAATLGWQEVFSYLAPLTSFELQKPAAQELPRGLIYRYQKDNGLIDGDF
jgi:ankyrin repeat protein